MPRTPTASKRARKDRPRTKAAARKRTAARQPNTDKAATRRPARAAEAAAGQPAASDAQQLEMISLAAGRARTVGRTLRQGGGKNFSRAANMILQQAAFDWALEHLHNGTFDLDNPAFAQLWLRMQQMVSASMANDDKRRIAEAQVKSQRLKIKTLENKNKQAAAAIDKLSQPEAAGLSLAARNAIRKEQGLPLLEECEPSLN